MMGDEGPPEIDVKDFEFRQMVKIRVSPSSEVDPGRINLLAVSNKYGLTFVGSQSGVRVLKTIEIGKKTEEIGKGSTVLEDFPFLTHVNTGGAPLHVALSSDNLTLSVCVRKSNSIFALMYDVRAFADQNNNPAPFLELRLTASVDTELVELCWNPGADFPSILASCLSDGSIALWEVKDSLKAIARLPPETLASCMCWSPKGKQLVVGKKNGTMCQYDQQLKPKKEIPCPSIFQSSPVSVVDVLWESTHVFLAAYTPVPHDEGDQPYLIIVNFPKGGAPSYVCYEDVCFGSGGDRKHKYYMTSIPDWQIIVTASANSLEGGVLGKHAQNANLWERWNLDDSGRASLPMTDDYSETYPMGMAIDFTSQIEIPVGENQTHPASPIFMMLSTEGILIAFHMMNSRAGATKLTRLPEILKSAGMRASKNAVSTAGPTQSAVTTIPDPSAASIARNLFQPPADGNLQTTAPKTSSGIFGAVAANLGVKTPSRPALPAMATAAPSVKPGVSFVGANPSEFTFTKPLVTSTPAPPPPGKPLGIFGDGQPPSTPPRFSAVGTSQVVTQPAAVLSKPSAPLTVSQAAFKPQAAQGTIQFTLPTPGKTDTTATTMPQMGPRPVSQKPPPPAVSLAGSLPGLGQFTIKAPPGAASALSGAGRPTGTQAAVPAVTGPPTASAAPGTQARAFAPPTNIRGSSSAPTPQQPPSAVTQVIQATQPVGKMTPVKPVAQPPPAKPAMRPAAPPQNRAAASQDRTAASQDADTTKNVYLKSIIEEMSHFQEELEKLKTRCAGLRSDIGTKEELQKLRRNTSDMVGFCTEIKDTTRSMNEEIHELRQECLESFSTLEECRQRQHRHADPSYQHLLKSRALDPLSQRKLKETRSLCQQVDSSVRNIDLNLDLQWEQYQRSKRANAMKPPATDAIYRTVMNNTKVIATQKQDLNDLCKLIQRLKLQSNELGSPGQSLNLSRGELEQRPELTNPMTSPSHVTSPLSPEKQAKLRQALGSRRVTPIKSTAPGYLSMSKIVSARALMKLMADAEESTDIEETKPLTVTQFHVPKSPTSSPISRKGLNARNSGSGTGVDAAPRSPVLILQPTSPQRQGRIFTGQDSPEKSSRKSASPAKPDVHAAAPPGGITIGQSKSFMSGSLFGSIAASQGAKSTHGFTSIAAAPGSSPSPSPKQVGFSLTTTSTSSAGAPAANPAAMFSFSAASTAQPLTTTAASAPTDFTFGSGSAGGLFRFGGSQSSVPASLAAAKTEKRKEGATTVKDEPTSRSSSLSSLLQGNTGSPTLSGLLTGHQSNDSSTAVPVSAIVGIPSPTAKHAPIVGPTTPPAVINPTTPPATVPTQVPTIGSSSNPASTSFSFKVAPSISTTKAPSAGFDFRLNPKGSMAGTNSTPSFTTPAATPAGSAGFAFNPGVQQFSFSGSAASAVSFTSKPDPAGVTTSSVSGEKPIFGQSTVTSTTTDHGLDGGSATATLATKPAATSQPANDVVTATPATQAKKELKTSLGNNSVLLSDTKTSVASPVTITTVPPAPTVQAAAATSQAVNFSFKLPGSASSAATTTTASSTAPAAATTTACSTVPAAFKFGVITSSDDTGSTTSGLFGQAQTATLSAPQTDVAKPLFGQASTSTAPTNIFGSGTTTSSSIFGNITTANTAATSVSGVAASSTTATTSSVFGKSSETSTASSIFGSGVTTATGNTVATTITASTSLFGSTAPTTTASTSLFGSTAPTTTASTSLFGSTAPTTTASTSLFGSTAPTTTASTSLFGSTAPTTTASTSLFGSTAPTTTASTSLFGSTASTTAVASSAAITTTASSLFGNGATTSAAFTSLFGSAASTAAPSTFGAAASTAAPSTIGSAASTAAPSTFVSASSTAAPSTFGAAASTAAPSTFGSASSTAAPSTFGAAAPASVTPTSTAAAPLFGNTTTTSSTPLFGIPTATSSTSSSIFGGGQQTSGQSSVFGAGTGTQPVTPGFGGQPSSGAGSTAFTGPSMFGQQPASGATTTSGGSSLFGGQTTTSASTGFGFGGASGGFDKPAFGQTATSVSQPASSGTGGGNLFGGGSDNGGGLFGGLGGKPSAENANKNVFGGNQTFGGNQQATGLFGKPATSTAFGTGTGQGFGGGTFSSGNSVSTGGFGAAPQSPSAPGGFGGPATFGSPPSFGSTAAPFGGAPGFGAASTFGGGATFGTSSMGGGGGLNSAAEGKIFGSSGTENVGFSGLVSGNTATFGSIAQQPTSPVFAGGVQEQTSAFGGGSPFGGAPSGTGFGSPGFSSQGSSFSAYRG